MVYSGMGPDYRQVPGEIFKTCLTVVHHVTNYIKPWSEKKLGGGGCGLKLCWCYAQLLFTISDFPLFISEFCYGMQESQHRAIIYHTKRIFLQPRQFTKLPMLCRSTHSLGKSTIQKTSYKHISACQILCKVTALKALISAKFIYRFVITCTS